ncbi:MAG: glycosyltransferase family 2 protein [Acidiferrobacterales bacterium]|nr:glycosyltransferase family 2 protein [Acidiferrobacterales bacterium]
MAKSVLAVVVTFNPKPDSLGILLRAASLQLENILIVDNGSSNVQQISDLVSECSEGTICNIRLNEQAKNLGLGAAHNIGIKTAKESNYEYVLLLDQDSVPMQGMVDHLITAHQKKSKSNQVSAVGVTYLNADNGSESFFVRFGLLKFQRQYCRDRDEEGCIEADFLISSGSLISIAALDQIGEMDESLFIDHVDTEWFLRADNLGYKSYGVCDAVMQHGLGESTHQLNFGFHFVLRKLFGLRNARRRNVPQHNPFRYYYIFRNSILLYKRGYASNLWKWNDLQRLCMIFVMFALIKSPRRKNLKMMLRGVYDGFRGVSGKLSESSI